MDIIQPNGDSKAMPVQPVDIGNTSVHSLFAAMPGRLGGPPNIVVVPGLSYRLWLIGMIASGPAAIPSHPVDATKYCINMADEIIRKLNAEINDKKI